MGRVKAYIEVNGRDCWTMFDTGARNTYVTEHIAEILKVVELPLPRSVGLGGKEHRLTRIGFLIAKIDGLPIEVDAYVIGEIGKDEDGKSIEILFGALAMQKLGIRTIPDEERLDLTHYPKEFVEF